MVGFTTLIWGAWRCGIVVDSNSGKVASLRLFFTRMGNGVARGGLLAGGCGKAKTHMRVLGLGFSKAKTHMRVLCLYRE